MRPDILLARALRPAAAVVVVGAASPRRAAILATIADRGHAVVAVHRDLDLALGDFARIRPSAVVLDLALDLPAALAAARRLAAARPGLAIALLADGWDAAAEAQCEAAEIRLIARRGARAALGLADLAAFLAAAATAPAPPDADLTGLGMRHEPAWTRLPAQGAA